MPHPAGIVAVAAVRRLGGYPVERVAVKVLRTRFPELRITGPSGDLNRDAFGRPLFGERDEIVLLVSCEARWTGKLKRDLGRYSALPVPDRPRSRRAPGTARRPRPRARCHPPGPRCHRRESHLTMAAAWRAARTADQPLPAGRTPRPDRHPPRPRTLRRAVPARHRAFGRDPRPPARHPYQGRGRLAARLRGRLAGLRRRRQPPAGGRLTRWPGCRSWT